MNSRFWNLPVQAKLALVVMAVCSSLVLLMAVALVIDKVHSFRQQMVQTQSMLAEVIASNSQAALLFRDSVAAFDNLRALAASKEVSKAVIYDDQGKAFAIYEKDRTSRLQAPELNEGLLRQILSTSGGGVAHAFYAQYLDLAAPIRFEDSLLGVVVIRADLSNLHRKLWLSIAALLAFLLGLGLATQLISVRLHKAIAGPLVALLDTMETVKQQKNYEARVTTQASDEFGMLAEGFNSMLAELAKRDEKLAEHREELEALVARRTRELVQANDKLLVEVEERRQIQGQLARAQRMEAIGTLAAGVAHDLNNILSGVVSYPELLLLDLPPEHEMHQPLVTIKASGQKAAAIVQDLLTLARRGATTMEVVDLQVVVEEYLNSAEFRRLRAQHPGVRITTQFAGNLLRLRGSSVHLSKVLMNLVTNAFEAIETSGELAISLSNVWLDRPVHGYDRVVEGNYLRLLVQDDGHGISADDQRFIFEPFYTKKKMGMSGTGLGMAVVWGTVEDHKGYIDLVSAPGAGTAFYLYFPATEEAAATIVEEDIKQYLGAGQSILVVDDLKEQRLIASEILRNLGYLVETAASGEEAVRMAQEKSYDLLVLDMIMEPGIDGIETYRRFLRLHPGQRALIASGYAELQRVEIARELGVEVFLRKPYTVVNLAKMVWKQLHETKLAN